MNIMGLETFIQVIVNGLLMGGIYALISAGLTLIYGVMYVFNFAHGEFLMMGMFLAYWGYILFDISPFLALPGVFALIFLFGALIQAGLIHPVLKTKPLRQILLLLGVSTLLTGLASYFFGTEPRTLDFPLLYKNLGTGFLVLNLPRTVAFGASIFIALALFFFLKYSKAGKAIRACSQSRDAARLMGINVRRVYSLTFGLGVGITAIAGALLATFYPITPTVGETFAIIAFAVVALGTMGNFIGALIGGLIIGVAEALGGFYISAVTQGVVAMSIFILILLFKPEGLFTKKNI
jgi:branched-chain amino acid transport system permease protein